MIYLIARAPRLALRLPMLLAVALLSAAVFWNGVAFAAPESSAREKPVAERRVPRPKTRSLEYRLTWGLASIRADRAYAAGLDGSGITVAMIDAGMTAQSMELFGNVSSASIDLVKGRRGGGEGDSHARQTATLLAAPLDGKGTLGVAYGARLLSIRIDAEGSCATECHARANDLARGIDYALAHGAKIIGVPMIGRQRLIAVEPALARAAAAGAVIVAAAGNDGWEEVAWPARYAVDPRFRDAILIVGASTFRGEAATWSNKAGRAADRYLVAPGENLLVDCGERSCALVSGTSYAVPFAAGALSLVMAANPDLTAQQAARILIASAQDRGSRARSHHRRRSARCGAGDPIGAPTQLLRMGEGGSPARKARLLKR